MSAATEVILVSELKSGIHLVLPKPVFGCTEQLLVMEMPM